VIEGNVHVSFDEGKSWERADIPLGQASMVIEHPFDNKYVSNSTPFSYASMNPRPSSSFQAFVLSRGTTHYRTADRGKSWQKFEMSIPPAFVAMPLSFHSDPTKYGYILYQGTSCDRFGWGARCHDEARSSST
jgi:Sortilin, neurotensin receptor 3,